MKSGLKYLFILFLFVGFISSEVYGSERLIPSTESRIATLSGISTPRSAAYTVDLPIILFQDMLVGDTNILSHYLKVHTHLLCNIKELKKSLFYRSSSQKNRNVANSYIHPLKYYVYTLEKIVI